MARKQLIYSYQFFNNQVVAADTTSAVTSVAQLDNASIDFRWAGSTLTANLEVQVRNGDNADWRTVDFGDPIAITGAAGAHDIIFTCLPFTDLRLFVDVTSGSATLDAVITAKSYSA